MLPWYNNGDRENPLEPLLLKTPSFSHLSQNPITPLLYSNFSSPIFDDHEQLALSQILHITPPEKPDSDPIPKPDPAKHGRTPPQKQKAKADAGSDCQPPRRRSSASLNPRKRTGKKDRHSKICTAKGFRDRRMRLSLQVARKFFDLQDILGYDKASCTIEWLFSKSKKAIQDLMSKKEIDNNNNDKNIFINFNLSGSDAKSHESLSECEVVSEFHEPSSNSGKESLLGRDKSTKNEKKITKNEKKMMRKAKPNNSREARENARARARLRTEAKKMIRRGEINSRQFGPISFSSHGCCDQNVELQKLGFSAEGTIEKLLGNSGFSMPNVSDQNGYENCKDLNRNMVGFCGNWEISGNNEERYGCSQVSVRNEGSAMAGTVSPSSVHSDLNFLFFHQ